MFITFEGADGSGKSTQVQLLKSYCIENNIPAVFTKEPGGTDAGQEIRKIILNKDLNLHPHTLRLGFYMDRLENLHKNVYPALEQNKIVVCDRYIDSTTIYQGVLQSENKDLDRDVFKVSMHLYALVPDITIFIDTDPKIAWKRIQDRNEKNSKKDTLESKGLDFQIKVHEAYRKLAKDNPYRIKKVNGNDSEQEVFFRILDILVPYLLKINSSSGS